MSKIRPKFRGVAWLWLMLVFSLVLAGCGGPQVAGVSQTEPPPSPSPVPSDTPVPTSTATPLPTETPTATPTNTPTATPDRKATQAARQTATQAVIDEMVGAELTELGIDPSLGRVVWVMDEPIELDGGGYSMGWFLKIQELGVLKDFVIQSDITWDTSGALAGCAYIFRGPEDWDVQTSDFYDVTILRNQYAPVWMINYFQDGYFQYSLPSAYGASSASINDDKMSKNTLTLDARGDTFTVYINGEKQQVIENNKVSEGRLALEVVQNSGTSYCKFENGWVWEYTEE